MADDDSDPGRDDEPYAEDDELDDDSPSEEEVPSSEEEGAAAADKAPQAKTPWRKRALSYGLQALVVLAILWGVTWYQARRLLPTRAAAPAFSLPALGGESVQLADARGRKVVLYFFAPWCTVCEFSSHNVRALRDARTDEELAIYAVGLGWEEPSELAQFAAEHELNVPVLQGDATVQRAYRVDTFPSIYIIDEDGRIEDRVVGYTTELGLRLRSL
ncbi:MAG: redoxin domain-containing protein [Deltaproteobacteria bacterium]|nr:redoxin domain-containing protein [Deltaproteobacteria bacterium]MBW2532311.1 redoxin domain-containing protein [Deltaproteobacteria bacterium]